MQRVWTRRAITVPLVALVCLLAWALAPLWLAMALLVDLARARRVRRAMATRLLGFALVYLAAEVLGLAVLVLVWLLALGGRDRVERLVTWTYAVQRRWAHALFVAARALLSLRFEIEGDELLAPGPLLVLVNHASLLDTLLPTVFITHARGIRLRFVLKRELLVSPCLDVAGLRLPNVFVDRSATQTAVELGKIRRLAEGLGPSEGVLIYPEGTRATPAKKARALAALGTAEPRLRALADSFAHVMPPRIGGTVALLDGAPDADVVLFAHRGLEGFARFADFLDGSLVGRTVRMRLWRVPRAEIPSDRDERARWLFAQWAALDRFVGSAAASNG
ncbi:MAG: 1-acyl-sn-glycerol-3-phosphate acyltransferase [Sandaracinaceae bacterium]|nr:1-acyl-sn-glycerol-3-phosphate acyltransferase [Sandaracinaceae bacterium]